MLTISSTIRRTRTPDGAVLLDVGRGRMFCLNIVGSTILDLIGDGRDEAEIAAQVSSAYRVNIDRVRADVREFLQGMSLHGIVQERAGQGPDGQ